MKLILFWVAENWPNILWSQLNDLETFSVWHEHEYLMYCALLSLTRISSLITSSVWLSASTLCYHCLIRLCVQLIIWSRKFENNIYSTHGNPWLWTYYCLTTLLFSHISYIFSWSVTNVNHCYIAMTMVWICYSEHLQLEEILH